MIDGYRAYNGLSRKEGITLLACWAHVRRKYIDAQRLKQGKPYTWQCRVLRELPKVTTVDAYEALLPWNQLPIEVLTNELALLND